MMNEEIVIDATNSVLGRVASLAAKQALLGKKVVIVNSEKAIITGNKKDILLDYTSKRRRGGVKGPFYPTKPHAIVKRAVRGMLSYKKGRGEEAFKRIICYGGVPKQYSEAKKLNLKAKKIKCLRLEKLG